MAPLADQPAPLRISVVTPSFNQGAFLQDTIDSVLGQDYPNLEYVIVDGGSSDGSLQIIRHHQEQLAWWTSEPDHGQYQAINKGFARTKGEVMAWLNSDDKYLPWTLATVAEVLADLPQIEWLTSRFHFFWDERGRPVRCEEHPGFSRQQVLRGGTLPGCGWPAWAFIQQEATFWRRSLWERAGGWLNDQDYPLAGDFDLWMRFAAHAQLYWLDLPLAGFRRHAGQQTAQRMQEYLRQAKASFLSHGGRPPSKPRSLWLKNTAKLLRYFGRRHAFASAQQGLNNRVARGDPQGRWELRDY